MTVDPIVSLIIGAAIFDEHFRNGPADVAGEALGLALVVAAAVGLTSSDADVIPRTSHPLKDHRTSMPCSAPSEAL